MTITKSLTWQYDVNKSLPAGANGVDEAQKMHLAWKNALIGFATNPWAVAGSSDSVTAGMDNVDRWTSSDKLVGVAATGAHAWIVLKDPVLGCQILLSMIVGGTANYEKHRFVMSPGGLFTGGSASADPTATDEIVINSHCYGRFFVGTSNTSAHMLHVLRSSTGQATMWIISRAGSNAGDAAAMTAFGYVGRLENATYANSLVGMWWAQHGNPAALDNTLFFLDNHNSGNHRTWFGNLPTNKKAEMYFVFPSVNVKAPNTDGAAGNTRSATWETRGGNTAAPNQILQANEMPSIGCYCATSGDKGVHGKLYDVRWCDFSLDSGETFPADGTRQWASFLPIAVPWNGTLPVLS